MQFSHAVAPSPAHTGYISSFWHPHPQFGLIVGSLKTPPECGGILKAPFSRESEYGGVTKFRNVLGLCVVVAAEQAAAL